MNVKVKGEETQIRQVEVKVDPIEVLMELKTSLCKVPRDSFVKDGAVVAAEVGYRRGKSHYEYKVYSYTPEIVSLVGDIDNLVQRIKNKISTY